MMPRNEDLGLSLSLGSSKNSQHPQLNLMPSVSQWSHLLASSPEKRQSPEGRRPMLKVIDVNRAAAVESKEVGTSSPNSVCGKRDHVLTISGDSGGGEEFSDEEGGDGSRKKLRLSKDQSAVLEESFNEHNTLNPKQKQALAKQLNLRSRQVEVWFQNRRARTKLKQTEVDCEFLKRCCENLTDENRRLQKEVAELRALKFSPQFYTHMTTLTMCPSCERVATSNNGGGGATTSSTLQANVDNRFLQHAHQLQRPFTGASATTMPWPPVPLRTASFLDVMHAQSS